MLILQTLTGFVQYINTCNTTPEQRRKTALLMSKKEKEALGFYRAMFSSS